MHLFSTRHQISLRTNEKGKLLLNYPGPRLNRPDEAFVSPSAEYPLYPTDDDSRSLWGNYSDEYGLHLRLPDGSWSADLLVERLEEGAHELRATLHERRYPELKVELSIEAPEGEDVFIFRTSLQNGTGATLLIQKAASLCLALRTERCHITTFRGGWSGENELVEQVLERGNTLRVAASTGTKTAQEGMPCCIISPNGDAQEETGRCLMAALAWSGNYALQFKHSSYEHLFASLGHDFSQTPYELAPGARLDLPPAVLTLSEHGKGPATRALHHYLRHHVIPHGTESRRSLLNSWEGVHFDVAEPALREIIRLTADLGAELFVLDDGWFSGRDNDTTSLGDWQPDKKKLPHGLTPLTQAAAESGIGFGLWIEPEMICPESELYRRHPEYALQIPRPAPRLERYQMVLNLTLPAVQEFILSTVRGLLREHPGISFIKWDCNRKVSDALSTNLYYDYIAAYYRIMSELRQEFPHVTFQCCSAGGGRLDYGAAAFHEEFWLSDNTDPLDRLRMQWAAGHFFPANAIGCHVTASPNLYTHRHSSIKYRFDVALAGRLGLELDPRTLSPEEREEYRRRIYLAHRLRPIVQLGDLYRLVSPWEGPDAALLYRHGGQALLLAYTTERPYTHQQVRIPVRGLEPDRLYRLTELEPDSTGNRCPLHGQILSGQYLTANGLPIRWTTPLQSMVLLLEPQAAD